ncbi:DNA sulfur modification protein DndB [Pseudomonas sp. PB101]|uniref:DNA sulfur modification protein DndB n=1 Tax=Pseudomonas sp. PB101 TaxID=2495428 RepID=UPI0013663790|nr:DNA sulfur modification protein DndB [Pseudomonas sp. PB101]
MNPTNGHIIVGSCLDGHRFIGRVMASQLFQIAPDPRDSENKKKLDTSVELQGMLSVREEVQRMFEGAKKKNVPAYAEYIISLKNGADGITPPITLYSEQALDFEEHEDNSCSIQVPWDQKLVAIDGETQLAARHEAANIDEATKKLWVPVYICHGLDKGWARQSFHDLNTLGVRPNQALSLGMDARDPLTQVTRHLERNVPFLRNHVNKVRRQLRSTDAHIVTITTLRNACVTFAKGINGVQYGSRPVPIDPELLPKIEKAAVEWFTAVSEAIGPALEDRTNKLASAPAVFAAVGALGSPLLQIEDDELRLMRAKELAFELKSIDWTRHARWAGIAGKLSPKNVLSVGGAKETAYAVYSALADDTNTAYKAIRPAVAVSELL